LGDYRRDGDSRTTGDTVKPQPTAVFHGKHPRTTTHRANTVTTATTAATTHR